MAELRTQNSELTMILKESAFEPAKTFQDLIVWQKAHQFVLSVYRWTRSFPAEERYVLVDQFRRAALSIPANIAEAFRKRGKDKLRYLSIAQSSLEECRYFLILARDLEYSYQPEFDEALQEVSKLLTGYTNKIQNSEF